jgi:Cytochrome P460
MGRMASLAIVMAGAACASVALAADDRAMLQVPDGLSIAEFKGYEDWRAVAVSQTDGAVKLVAANPTMMAAYKAGLPASGRRFPEGSRIVKIEWVRQPNPASPYAVQVPGALKSLSFIVKDSKRFPSTRGWAYAKFVSDASGALKPEGTGAECGFACHTRVAAQDYIFTAYPPR